MKSIGEIIDIYLDQMSKKKYLMVLPGEILNEMLDETVESDTDWKGWKPIPSNLGTLDINKFEELVGLKIPPSYVEFLCHKYFYQFKINDHSVNLLSNLPDPELRNWYNTIIELEVTEELLKQGFLYIGDFNDYGFLCFNCNINNENGEHPIYYIDHAEIEDIHFYANSFREILENDQDHGNRFIMKLNKYHESNKNDT